MKIKFHKLHPDAQLPGYAHPHDGAMDLYAVTQKNTKDCVIFGTGLSIEIPAGSVGLLFPRSSVYKTSASLANSVGVIDGGYRGEVQVIFRRHFPSDRMYNIGDRVAQLMIVERPKIEPEWADELSTSERGSSGFGSTGDK